MIGSRPITSGVKAMKVLHIQLSFLASNCALEDLIPEFLHATGSIK